MYDSYLSDSDSKPKTEQQVYKKIKVLGEGSMGKAYLVESKQDNNLYVMKRINIGHLEPKDRQNAMREAQLHSIVEHPHIIKFKEIYHTTKDKLCIIMEYADGGDLDEFIKQQNGKTLPTETILKYFTQICLGLNQIHSKKIIHRDIKGANIFLTKDKNIKIGDFGISKAADQTMQASKTFVGTPYYLCPEIIEGKPFSNKADVWSLGVLLYHLCALQLPFQANSLPLLALKILRGSFPPLKGPFSRELKALVLSLLQVNPNKRPSIKQILTKPLLSKYVPQEYLTKINTQLKQQKQTLKISSKTIKPTKKQPIKKQLSEEQTKKQQANKRQQAKRKRDQYRQQMKEDLNKKRKQNVKKKDNLGLEVTSEKIEPKRNVKTSLENFKAVQKTDNKASQPTNTMKQKPWKVAKNSGNSSRQIEVELFLPSDKPKRQKKEEEIVIPAKNDFKVQIFQGPRFTCPDVFKQQAGEQIAQKVENSQINVFVDQKEQTLQDMLKKVNDAQQAVKGISNAFETHDIELYEQSQTFDSTEFPNINKNNEENKKLEQQMKYINNINNNTENLEQCREVLEAGLGQENFIKAYNILWEHLQESEQQKLRGQQLDDYTFNRQVIRKKMDFLTDEVFNGYIVLMYTLLILEDQEMKKNFDSDEEQY